MGIVEKPWGAGRETRRTSAGGFFRKLTTVGPEPLARKKTNTSRENLVGPAPEKRGEDNLAIDKVRE